RLAFAAPADVLRYVVEKGSITVDGVSLTVAAIDDHAHTFEIAVIPHTLAVTTLGTRQVADPVNLAVDVLAKYVERLLRPSQGTPFTAPVDARHGTTTGISAADRATTVHAVLDAATRPEDLARPGHIFPLRYREGGVLKRAGHTEAAVDLARLAGMHPAGVLAEVVNDDGTMARMPRLEQFAAQHGLQLISSADLIRYRRHRE